ncbi:hypothetical protein LTS10_005518 [Elasticomyces elasticus]|nr:hypothetical protein LTS10_005518 [Elasticomyces elasticus]
MLTCFQNLSLAYVHLLSSFQHAQDLDRLTPTFDHPPILLPHTNKRQSLTVKFLLAILTLVAALASAVTLPTAVFAESNTTAFNIITNITASYDTTTDWEFSSNTTARASNTQPECSNCGYGVSGNLAAQAILAFCTAYDGINILQGTVESL